jgi:TPR repeat protein
MNARHLAIAVVAMLFVPSFLSNLAGPREREAVAETIVGATKIGSQNAQTKGRPEDGSPGSDRDGDRMRENRMKTVFANEISGARQAASQTSLDPTGAEIQTLKGRVGAETTVRIEIAQASDEQKDALEQERRRGDALARELASVREELEMRKAAAKAADDAVQTAQALATEHQQVGERERQRGEVLARQLASAQKEVETLTARVTAMTDARTEAETALQAAQASVAEQRQALELEQQRAAVDTKGSVGKRDRTARPAREPQGAEIVERTEVAVPPPRAIGEQIALWVKRAEDLTAAGDFVSARLMLQRVAETGDAKAALMLAESYDPNVLSLLRAKGVAPDIAMARLWYEKAKALGSPEAQRRLERLDQPN